MSRDIEIINSRILLKFNIVNDLCSYLKGVLKSFSEKQFQVFEKRISTVGMQIEKQRATYQSTTTNSIANYYKNENNSEYFLSCFKKDINAYMILDALDSSIQDIENIFSELISFKGKPGKEFLKFSESYEYNNQKKNISTIPSNSIFSEFNFDEFIIESQNSENSENSGNNLNTLDPRTAAKMTITDTVMFLIAKFKDQKINLTIFDKPSEQCPDCKVKLVNYADSAEMKCEDCGYVISLHGTIYEDPKQDIYNMQSSKNKRYDPNGHCEKRLKQIQAKEDKNIPDEDIKKIDALAVKEYTIRGILRPMDFMSCRQIRKWLKQLKLTNYNHNTPLVRKRITALHGKPVVPPSLTPDEESLILVDFNITMGCYEKVVSTPEYIRKYSKPKTTGRQRSQPNKVYYWFMLFKIISHHLAGDKRLNGLLECIHLQSSDTVDKNDDVWRMICEFPEMKDYHAGCTNRGLVNSDVWA